MKSKQIPLFLYAYLMTKKCKNIAIVLCNN